MTETLTPSSNANDENRAPESRVRSLRARITRLEVVAGAVIATAMLALALVEPDILEAPFENERTLLFTFGGTALAAIAFVAMLALRVPAAVRLTVLVVPFVFVNWWLLSPYFVDEVVDERFATSIAEQLATVDEAPAVSAGAPAEESDAADGRGAADDPAPVGSPVGPGAVDQPASDDATAASESIPTADESAPAPAGPVLVATGRFVGLAGHDGTGDAGLFRNPDGSLTLRFENFDIENGPDLEVFLVPGADQVSLPDGSVHLGALKGNIGDQNYELPAGLEITPGSYTVLVWCEAFSVEFVGATIVV